MLVLNWTPQTNAEQALDVATKALKGGVNWLMMRVRDLPPRLVLDPALQLRQLTRTHSALFSVNPYPALAEWADADGVHLPESALVHPLPERTERLVGYSVHSLEKAQEAMRAGADYLLVGTMFPTASHPDKTPEGVELLRMIHEQVPLPLIAIGGISPERVRDCLEVGAIGVAVVSGIADSENPEVSARRYWQTLQV